MTLPQEQHQREINENLAYWQAKPILHAIYRAFYGEIARHVRRDLSGAVVELGSGLSNLKTVLPDCVCTDIFPHPWLDQVENAYTLSFGANTVSNLILFDVFHHLAYPGTALQEFQRVLTPQGRVLVFEPAVSLLGLLVYGLLHHEPLGLFQPITWFAPPQFAPATAAYYAAQGNASRIFGSARYRALLADWKIVAFQRFAAISYVASGGYRKPQLYPDAFLPVMQQIDRLAAWFPSLCATRLLVVLEKSGR